jgi:hypothetical protein
MIVLAWRKARGVAIQLDCFVAARRAAPANEHIQFVIASPAWRARQSS